MIMRKIVTIDQEKCDGCGQCVPSCEEGAIRIEQGKARLVSDVYCDGLGACLGHCPQGAISLVERDAEPFDAELVAERNHVGERARGSSFLPIAGPAGCPGTATVSLLRGSGYRLSAASSEADTETASLEQPCSRLANWPVQLSLVPPHAPQLRGADLLLSADCVPFAFADFHRRFLDGRPVLVGCPKLDDGAYYVQKLAQIIGTARVRSIRVLHMEVPCCTGLVRIARDAIDQAGANVPLDEVTISLQGRILGSAAS